MIFYAHNDQGISCKSLFNARTCFLIQMMMKEYPASFCSKREYDFWCILWWRNILQVFVQWENTIFDAYYDEEISCKSLFNERIWFLMHIMMKKYPASLCSMREHDFLLILWWVNILQVSVQWENMIFNAYFDEEILSKSLFNERIWFLMHIMMKKYPASLCSMREYDFLCIFWWRNI